MKHVLILLFALGITIAATSTVHAQDSDEAASQTDECRPLLTPEGAPPDTLTCSETQGQLVANYRGTEVTDIDRFEKTAEAKEALKAAKKAGKIKDGEENEGDE